MHLFLFALLIISAAFGGQRLYHLVDLFRLSRHTRRGWVWHECTHPQDCDMRDMEARILVTHREIRAELISVAVLEFMTLGLLATVLMAGR